MNFFNELKRRNVFKVAAAYIIVGWLIMQVGDTLAPALHLPEWINSALAFFLILGFPLALFFAWAFEMTPEGIKKEKDVDRGESITHITSKKLNGTIMALMVLALGYFAFDKFVLDPGRDAAEIEAAIQTAQESVPKPTATENENSIAVLPFVNMSSDEEQEYFSDGLSEELLNLLAKIPELKVAARTSSFSFKGQNIEIPEIASRLGVANVLEGSVRKAGSQVRITAQLIHAEDGFHLWSDTWDRELENIFQIQDEIAAAVVDSLKVTLLGETPKSTQTDPEAYRLHLEGQYFTYQRDPEALRRAIDLFKQAVEIDPGYAPAWAELAFTYQWYTGSGNMPIAEGAAQWKKAIKMALAADPEYGWAHFVRGVSLINFEFKIQEGTEAYLRAYALDPGNAMIAAGRGFVAAILGEYSDGLRYSEAALALDPVMPELHTYVASAHWGMLQFDEAITAFRKALELSPGYPGNFQRIARILLQQGKPAEALEAANKEPSHIYRLTSQSMAHFALGNSAESDRLLEELIEIGAEVAAYQISQVYGMRGDADQAFEWLERSYANRDSGTINVVGDPSFFSLLEDPRFEAIVEKIGLSEAWRNLPPEWGGPRP
ncbi:MAG: tetratricopeptide repeat protein [Gammaproteobacteria bacterium]|nr:tetratricopeptide repeat protein [Gammaproteobacteria bacterium]NNE05032.1 tetratricopeptide repeat protein [Xanthomonadales bacterium]